MSNPFGHYLPGWGDCQVKRTCGNHAGAEGIPPSQREPSQMQKMKSLVQVLLLCALCAPGYTVPAKVNYVPEITPRRIAGRITQTTVALEQPRCVFDPIESICTSCYVWLVVANAAGVSNFDGRKNNFVDPEPLAFQNASMETNGFYLTARTERRNYNCPPTIAPGQISALRVGAEVPCTTPNCNGPLATGGTFRMKYILINPKITPNIRGETDWSREIKLLNAVDPSSIDTSPGRRTGGMVVITTILAILLFLLLALFAAMLAMVCCKKSGMSDFPEPLTTSDSLRKYHTHTLRNKQGVDTQKRKI